MSICKEIIDECKLGKNEIDSKYIVNQETTRILVKSYISEFNYTNNYVSLYANQIYTIIIYKNRECISELSLEMPKVDFQDCYNKVKSHYQILDELIIVIIDKKPKNNGQTSYSFFHPEIGYKLNAEEICKNETIVVKENLTSILSEGKNNFNLQTSLTDQGINIFDLNDPFYTDLCYDFDNPSNKDIPLSERISTIYPDVSLCDEGCQMDGIDLETMTASCNCKFKDIENNNVIKENALLDNVVGDVFDFIAQSNILVMKCYDYIFDHFSESIGGIISLVAIGGHLICTLSYFIFGYGKIKVYIYRIFENFLSFINQLKANPPKKTQKLKEALIQIRKPEHNMTINERRRINSPNVHINSKKKKTMIKIDRPHIIDFDVKNTEKEIMMFNAKSPERVSVSKFKNNTNAINTLSGNSSEESRPDNFKKNSIYKKHKIKNKSSSAKLNQESINEMNQEDKYKDFFDEYLSTSLDDLEYDDAIVKDHRTFCEYLMECLKEKQMIAFTFIASDPIKIRIIKIMLFILNFILYFVVIGLFYSEDYIKQLYHLDDKKERFFSYITRSIDKFIYTTLVSIIIGYIVDCFFLEEKKVKGIFKREKENINNLRKEIINIIKEIQTRYITFIIIIFVILFIALYYLLCFNYVYPKTQIEWIKASVTIFIIMQILSCLKCLLETCLRFLSFKCKSEKLFKLSKLLD